MDNQKVSMSLYEKIIRFFGIDYYNHLKFCFGLNKGLDANNKFCTWKYIL